MSLFGLLYEVALQQTVSCKMMIRGNHSQLVLYIDTGTAFLQNKQVQVDHSTLPAIAAGGTAEKSSQVAARARKPRSSCWFECAAMIWLYGRRACTVETRRSVGWAREETPDLSCAC
jgi:hypothetical protein